MPHVQASRRAGPPTDRSPARPRRTSALARAVQLLICALLLLAPSRLAAEPPAPTDPDYGAPSGWALPWDCDTGYRVTWEPAEHWAHGKATGIAYDLGMPEGTPIYAPTDGLALYQEDTRPYETNFGNYIELQAAGGWVIRLAHLRDRNIGERKVTRGELLGYSGRSGVPQAHLHLELLVRDGTKLVRPDSASLTALFGLPIEAFVEGAIIVNAACPPRLVLDAPLRIDNTTVALGDASEIAVALRNDSAADCPLDSVQLVLSGPLGETLVAERTSAGEVSGKSTLTVRVPVLPNAPGQWRVHSVICSTPQAIFRLDADFALQVRPATLRLGGLALPSTVQTGSHIGLRVAIVNAGTRDRAIDGIVVEGLQPDGVPWRAATAGAVQLPARSTSWVELSCANFPARVGVWQANRLGYVQDGSTFYLAPLQHGFDVVGPEIRITTMSVYRNGRHLNVLLRLTNVGTQTVMPDTLELWGWLNDSDAYVTLYQPTPAPLAPQATALVQLTTSLDQDATVQFVEAGYWVAGRHFAVGLPN